jgi:hypothetical protein
VPERGETPEAKGEEMKSEQELRQYRRGVGRLKMKPCTCKEEGKALECAIGGEQMKAMEWLIGWILGDGTEDFRFAERIMEAGEGE